jgi:hypothetical protein
MTVIPPRLRHSRIEQLYYEEAGVMLSAFTSTSMTLDHRLLIR